MDGQGTAVAPSTSLPSVYPALRALYGARVPDFSGLFLRGFGSQSHAQENGTTIGVTSTLHLSGALGQVQGDAGRSVTGAVHHNYMRHSSTTSGERFTGPFSETTTAPLTSPASSGYNYLNQGFDFDTSRVVPTANENRPANTAVRYIVKALP